MQLHRPDIRNAIAGVNQILRSRLRQIYCADKKEGNIYDLTKRIIYRDA